MTRKDAELRERTTKTTGERPKGLSRRSLLKGVGGAALAAAGASLASVMSARAQVGGLEPGPVVPTFRLPSGSLSYLDRKQYIHNMEVVSHISGATISGGEPLMAHVGARQAAIAPGRRRFGRHQRCRRNQCS